MENTKMSIGQKRRQRQKRTKAAAIAAASVQLSSAPALVSVLAPSAAPHTQPPTGGDYATELKSLGESVMAAFNLLWDLTVIREDDPRLIAEVARGKEALERVGEGTLKEQLLVEMENYHREGQLRRVIIR